MKPLKTPKNTAKELSKAKKKLWPLVAKLAKDGDNWTCFTCGAKGEGKFIHAGHFISRNHQSTYYDLRNIHAQCINCNFWKGGELGIYAQKLIKLLGIKGFDNLVETGQKQKRWELNQINKLIESAKKGYYAYTQTYKKLI